MDELNKMILLALVSIVLIVSVVGDVGLLKGSSQKTISGKAFEQLNLIPQNQNNDLIVRLNKLENFARAVDNYRLMQKRELDLKIDEKYLELKNNLNSKKVSEYNLRFYNEFDVQNVFGDLKDEFTCSSACQEKNFICNDGVIRTNKGVSGL